MRIKDHYHAEPREINAENMPADVRSSLHALARGYYQSQLLSGRETWSGAGLRGRAKSYAANYSTSRNNLIDRIDGWAERNGYCGAWSTLMLNGRKRWQRVVVVDRGDGGYLIIW